MQQEIYITSLVIQVFPPAVTKVAEQLAARDEVEVAHIEPAAGKIIAIIETDCLPSIQQHIERINALNGVVSTTMVYQHCESGRALDEVLA